MALLSLNHLSYHLSYKLEATIGGEFQTLPFKKSEVMIVNLSLQKFAGTGLKVEKIVNCTCCSTCM